MAIYQWNLAQLHFSKKSMKYGIIQTEIWQTKNNWKKWQRINENWHTSELGIKVKLCQNFHFHLFDMIWEPLELEESKYSTESWLLNQLLLTMLVQTINLAEFDEADQEIGVGYFWQGCICVSLYFHLTNQSIVYSTTQPHRIFQ